MATNINQRPKTNAGEQTLETVEEAFKIIEFLQDQDTVGVTEVADLLDIPKSTAYVYLNTLHSLGYVHKKESKYKNSLRFLQLGGEIRAKNDFYQVARPFLHDIAAEVNELVELQVEESGLGILLMRAESKEAVDDNTPVGVYEHLHESAVGKAILAHLPEERVNEIIEQYGLPSRTSNTISDRVELKQELEQIREDGIAISLEEAADGVRGVGTAIESESGEVYGGLSISGPTGRMTEQRIEDDLVPLLKETSNVIELKLRHY